LAGNDEPSVWLTALVGAVSQRSVFTARMVEHLQALADPGVGDVDRALRAALVGAVDAAGHHRVAAGVLGLRSAGVRPGLEAGWVGRRRRLLYPDRTQVLKIARFFNKTALSKLFLSQILS
jgi:hypothetical protein